MRAARLAVGLALAVTPLAQAVLLAAGGGAAWPTVAAVAAGLLLRLLAGATPAVVLALGLAPIWQVLASSLGAEGGFDHAVTWLAFLGGGLAWPSGRGWRPEGAWGVALAAWALVLTLTGPVVALRELDFSWYTLGAATVNGTHGGPPHQAAAFVLLSTSAQIVALLVFDWYWSAAPAARRWAWMALLPGTAAAGLVAVWQQQVDPAFLSRQPWTGLLRSPGTFFDANATGGLLALTVPILIAVAARPSRVPPALWGGIWLALSLAGIIATGSRSALAAWAVVLVVQAVAIGSARLWLALAGAVGLAAAFGVFAPSPDPSTGPAIGRLADTIGDVLAEGPSGFWRIAWDRDGYGPAALAMIADHPWVGIGPGTFGGLVADYAQRATGLVLPPDNAQNWWRHQAAELGLLGALPAFVCSLLALVALVRALRRGPTAAAAAPLIGLGLLALMSPPTAHPILCVIVGLVVAYSVTAVPPAPPAPRPLPARLGAAVWVLAIACAVGSGVEGWREFRPPYRATRFHFPYSYGVTDVEPTPWGDGRWMTPRAVAVVPPAGRTLVARVVVPHEDASARPVRVTVSTRAGVACTHEAVDAAPFECRMAVPYDAWPMVRVDVSRRWRVEGGMTRAAVVTARFED